MWTNKLGCVYNCIVIFMDFQAIRFDAFDCWLGNIKHKIFGTFILAKKESWYTQVQNYTFQAYKSLWKQNRFAYVKE